MESADLHHQHHLQQDLVGSSSLATPSYSGVGSNHTWNTSIILDGVNFNPNVTGVLTNSRELRRRNENIGLPSISNPMIQDLGFQWDSHGGCFTNHSAHELHLARIKEEFSDSFPKFTEMINSPSNVENFHLASTSEMKNEPNDLHDLNENTLLKTFSSCCQLNGMQLSAGQLYPRTSDQSYASFGSSTTSSRVGCSRIFPSTNISNLNPSSSSFSNSFGMNLQARDLLSSTKFGGSFSQHPHNNMSLFRESPSFSLDDIQESSHRPSNSPRKLSSSPCTNGVAETKRPSNFLEPKISQAAPKKPRSESRSSCPPFKVRKEKLGDRIAALQQLVAPFGKTDTASVLMEAIGYIKFLQDQIETLSVPYMKSTRNNNCMRMRGASSDERSDEPKRDLRSRGLCLVPLSCTSYVTNDSGGVWPPP